MTVDKLDNIGFDKLLRLDQSRQDLTNFAKFDQIAIKLTNFSKILSVLSYFGNYSEVFLSSGLGEESWNFLMVFWSTRPTNSDHYFYTWCLYVRPYPLLKNSQKNYVKVQ